MPDLAEESPADVQMVSKLFGVKAIQKKDKLEEISLEVTADGRIASSLDIRVKMSKALIVDGVPFKRYHLTGAELEAHKARVQEKTHVD